MHRCAVAATTSGRFTTPSQSAPRWQKSCGQSPRGVSAVMTSGTRSKDRVSSRVSPKSFASGVARSRSGSWGTRTRALVSDTVDGSGGVPLSNTPLDSAPLKYEIVQGALVRWSHENPEGPHPPTAVLIHGILGSRRNLLSFAKRLAQKFPSWQFVLVDLRCHGQTANMDEPPTGEHSVTSAAQDVLSTLNKLKLYPNTLLGHSFGGKVAMSMVHQFGKRLPRPVQVWVLDTVPGDVWATSGDHPRDTINYCQTIPIPIASRKHLVDSLTGAGFTIEGAQWMTTNLTAVEATKYPDAAKGSLQWTFDLTGIVEMYKSYEKTDLWPMLETPPIGLEVDFVRAERSAFVWDEKDVVRMTETGARVHFLPDASHWVHIDNPEGLLEILAPSFGVVEDRRK